MSKHRRDTTPLTPTMTIWVDGRAEKHMVDIDTFGVEHIDVDVIISDQKVTVGVGGGPR